jgi:hypothetical protein
MTPRLSAIALASALLAPAAGAATFVVDNDTDAPDHTLGDGVCYVFGGGCTLRAAIEQANALPGPHTIHFDFSGAPTTISPGTSLPSIATQVTIDGYAGGTGTPNTLATGHDANIRIRLDGTNIPGAASGLSFLWGSAGSVVRGLAVTRFGWYGVVIGNAANVTVAGNFIGTDGSGTGGDETGALANGFSGIEISNNAAGATIGGSAPADRNLIVGAGNGTGIRLSYASATTVRGNYLGTDRAGTSRRGTETGIAVSRTDGTTTIEGNVIGAGQTGVSITNGVNDVLIQSNLIGVGADGAASIGGTQNGVLISNGGQSAVSPARITVGGNTMAHWAHNGIRAQRTGGAAPALRHLRFTRNSLFGNGALGIELINASPSEGATPGSLAPANVNSGQNPPTIQGAASGAGGTAVQFSFAGAPGTSQTLEVFANTACHASGWGEGRIYLGETVVTTDASGHYTGIATLPPVPMGTWLTMTASSEAQPGQYETSEFSQCVQVQGGGPAPVPTLGHALLALMSALVASGALLGRRRLGLK